MQTSKANKYDLLIIGAGAAGLAAAAAARRCGLRYALVEASARIGGRAQTDWLLPGCPVDLGCHYLHSVGINPFVGIARRFGYTLQTRPHRRRYYRGTTPLSPHARGGYLRYCRQSQRRFVKAAGDNRDVPLSALLNPDSPHAPFERYYLSLLHSVSPSEVSVFDAVLYRETGLDLLIKEGFGALIVRYGCDLGAFLRCPVTAVDWGQGGIRAHTADGDIRADAAIMTASPAALRRIRFFPSLPDDKTLALDNLPMGNYKHLYGELTDGAFSADAGFDVLQFSSGAELFFHVRPFGLPYIETSVAGVAADEMDARPAKAQRDFLIAACKNTFGNAIARRIGRFVSSNWRGNRWVRGAYSAARPGHGLCRRELARPLCGRLYFAGEATSADGFNTAHGAHMSGLRAVREFSRARRV